jgi:RNA-directed DNA polymerase
MKIIRSTRDLAWTLGIPIDRLRKIADSPASNYQEFTQWKDETKRQARTIRNPKENLKSVQRLIKKRLIGEDAFGPEVQGGVSGRSPKSNAEKHVGALILVNVDVQQFFDNVDHRAVFRTLRGYGYSSEVARLLTKLTTRKGLLPQGAPTSSAIANLVLARPVDAPTRIQAENGATVFTRYVDDIGLSGKDPAALIGDVARRLSTQGLSIHRGAKLKVQSRSMPQTITGLNINSGRPTVPQRYLNDLRAEIHRVVAIADAAERTRSILRIKGRIAYVRRYQPGAAKRLEEQLARRRR